MNKIKFMNLALVSLAISLFCVAINNKKMVLIFIVVSAIFFIAEILSPKQYLVSYVYRKNNQSVFEYRYISLWSVNEDVIKSEIIKPLMMMHNIRMNDVIILGITEV